MDELIKEKWFKQFKKGDIFEVDGTQYRIASDLVSSGNLKLYYVDIITNHMSQPTSSAIRMGKNQGLIIRNKVKLEARGYTPDEVMAIMAHELGHLFSDNQKDKDGTDDRTVEDELDSDKFAVEKCGIDPEVLESALRKDYNFKMKQLEDKMKSVPIEKVNAYKSEMEKRILNAQRMQQEIQR